MRRYFHIFKRSGTYHSQGKKVVLIYSKKRAKNLSLTCQIIIVSQVLPSGCKDKSSDSKNLS